MKKIFRLSIIFVIVILQLASVPTIVRADDIFTPADTFVDKGKTEAEETIDTEHLRQGNAIIYNVLFAIGVALAVIIGGILGIRFMVASVEDKAQIKELIVPYIIGCVVVFGAFGIWKLVAQIGENLG